MMRRRTINTLLIGVRISASPNKGAGRDALDQRPLRGTKTVPAVEAEWPVSVQLADPRRDIRERAKRAENGR